MTPRAKLNALIKEVEGKILLAEDHIEASVSDVEELKYWRGKNSQLREEKRQLREEELLLLRPKALWSGVQVVSLRVICLMATSCKVYAGVCTVNPSSCQGPACCQPCGGATLILLKSCRIEVLPTLSPDAFSRSCGRHK